MGIVFVAFLAARVVGVELTTSTSTLSCNSSSTRAGNRSGLPSAYRYSKVMFLPSTYPSARSSLPSNLFLGAELEPLKSRPILGTFPCCCASAKRTQTKAKPSSKTTTAFLPIPALFTAVRCRLSRTFFLAPCSSDELYLFERRADMNSGILRNEARQLKNFAVRLSYETVGNFAALHGLPILADVVKAISQFMP